MQVELPLGDVVDKMAILVIKDRNISDAEKLKHVRAELETLRQAWTAAGYPDHETLPDWPPLLEVNGKLWDVEDEIRECERAGDFGPRFIELARSVYRLNDKRAEHKRNISIALGSRLLEQKSYKPY
ncbi:MAG: hypothetical protein KF696_01715 [Planctomycetes bacterium]|nr:hypothetical protein [Planctomycetota bacterium]MCW8134693.1 hypothetical protein [Planctomycetota bacterium]